MSQILSVWIEEGCITCDACQETCPEVFSVTDDTCFIIAETRTDGKFDQNEGQAAIKVEIGTEFAEDIVDAAEGCPVEVIKFTTGESTDAPVEEAAPAVEVVAEEEDVSAMSAGAAAASGIEQPDIEVSLSIFRYNPLMAESGRDTYDVTVPGHASLQDVLVMLKETQDGSLTFRTSSGAGSNPLCGLSVNGNLVLADCVRMIDLMAGAGEPAKIRIEPLPGHQILKDLYVSTKALDVSRERAKPWLRTIDRVGANTPQGTVIGVMSSTKATALHAMNDLVSDHLLHSLSETVPHNPSYLGPAVLNRLWVKVNDPRISKDCKEEMREILQGTDGVWAESDLGVMARFGRMGQRASQNYNDCRSELLRAHRFAGKSGRHVKWFCKTVKSSGTLNETILAAQTMGPIGAIANLPATLRMALGFTRTGGPMVRDLQGWIAPGKMPPIINKSVHDHHEVVALFNEFDKRF